MVELPVIVYIIAGIIAATLIGYGIYSNVKKKKNGITK